MLGIPFAIYMMSLRSGGNSIFHERYMLASILGWTILLAHVAHRALLMRHRRDLRDLTLALTAAGFLRLGHRIPDPLLQTKSQPLQAAPEPT